MKYISPLISDARNKLGGSVFARNRSGVYARARVSPVQPRTPSQQANRALFTTIVQSWRTLTAAQRQSWNAAAPSVTLKDSIGQSFNPSGFQLFVSCNKNVMPAGFGLIRSFHPKPSNWDQLGGVLLDYEQSSGEVSVLSVDTINDQGHGDSICSVYLTGALGPGISFVQPHLYRLLASQTDDTLPIDVTAAWSTQYGTALPSGSQIATLFRQIDSFSGFQIAEYKAMTTIA